MTENLKQAALYYAEHYGWAVFPLIPRTKKPATQNGYLNATTDRTQIEEWWNKNPDYNIGVATGEMSGGLTIYDLDEHPEKGKYGIEVFDEWQKKNGGVPDTAITKSGSGGRHLWFINHDGLKNREEIFGCIDIRGVGGYIVAPPSIHETGNRYSWIQSPDYHPLATTTAQLVELAKTPSEKSKKAKEKSKGQQATTEKVKEGSRTSTLISKIGELCNTSLDKQTIKATIRALNSTFEPPLTDEELNKEVFPALDRGWQEEEEIPDFNPINGTDLLNEEIPELKFLVNDICPAGLGVIAAPPKYYKSFLALQLCVALSSGSKFLDRKTTKTKCLYFDLESTRRRPQSRLKAMMVDHLDEVDFITQNELPKVNKKPITLATGFDKALDKHLTKNPEIGFVVIDVFKKIRTEQKKTQSLYDHDYADIEKLQAIAGKHNVSILLLHHTTKMKDQSDPFNNMSGSTGLLGAVDYAWIINKDNRNDKQATLSITGRDIESEDLTVEFDKIALKWRYIGTAEEIQAQNDLDSYDQHAITQTIRKLVEQYNGTWTGTTTDLIKFSEYLPLKIREKSQQVGRFIQKNSHYLAMVDDLEQTYHTDGHQRKYTFTKKANNNTTNN